MKYLKDCYRKRERDGCEGVFHSPVVLCDSSSFHLEGALTQWHRLGIKGWKVPFSFYTVHPSIQGDESGVKSWTAANPKPAEWSRTEGRPRVKDPSAFFHSPKFKVCFATTHSNPACFHVCAQIISVHSFLHPSMLIPFQKEGKEKV